MRKIAWLIMVSILAASPVFAQEEMKEKSADFFGYIKGSQYKKARSLCTEELKSVLSIHTFSTLWANIAKSKGSLVDSKIADIEKLPTGETGVRIELAYEKGTVKGTLNFLQKENGQLLINGITLPEELLPKPISAPPSLENRVKQCIKKLATGNIAGSFAMLDPDLQDKMSLKDLKAQVSSIIAKSGGPATSVTLVTQRSSAAGLRQIYFFRCDMPHKSLGASLTSQFDGERWRIVRLTIPCNIPPPFNVGQSADEFVKLVCNGMFEKAYGQMDRSLQEKETLNAFRRRLANLLTEAGRSLQITRLKEGYLDTEHKDFYCYIYRTTFRNNTHLIRLAYINDNSDELWSLTSFLMPFSPPVPTDGMEKTGAMCVELMAKKQFQEARAMWRPSLQKLISLEEMERHITPFLANKGELVAVTLGNVSENEGIHSFVYTVSFTDGVLKGCVDFLYDGTWTIAAVKFPY